MSQLETVKVVRKDSAHGYKIINKADYDPKKHTLFKGKEADQAEPEGGLDEGRNPSGTYSEPTPTDVRYPDKDATEFENNHGAFVGKSAAELRDEKGLPDAPGGLQPDPNFVPGSGEVTEAAEKVGDDKAAKTARK